MGIANDLKGLTMLGRFAPNSLASLALFVVFLQFVYNSPALAKPRPQQFLNTKQWTDSVTNRHWLHIDSRESPENHRHKRGVSKQDDVLQDQNGIKVLTASTEKREGIETPIEPLKAQDTTMSNEGHNLRSKGNEPDGGRSVNSGFVRQNIVSSSTDSHSGTPISKPEKTTPSGSSVRSINQDANSQKREEVMKSNTSGSKTQANNADNISKTKQESVSVSSIDNDKEDKKPNSNTNVKQAGQETQGNHPDSVTIQGNTINGRPMSTANSEPVRDPLGNSGSEVVTSHPSFEAPGESSRYPYRDARSKENSKASTEPEVGHFQVDDKSADLEINANSAGVKVKAKPASLQVVSRPGAHPPTPIVPVGPFQPYFHHHHHHHYHPYFGYRRSLKPYHRRLYDNPYHAHYRAWIPPPGHHFHRYWQHYHDDEPSYRRSYEPYRYPYPYHHHHHHHHRYPDLYERANIEDNYPRYRRWFRGPYSRRMYRRREYGDFDTRFHIPRRPGPYVRNIVTPIPPPVNVYGNPPPDILANSPAARFFGANQMSALGGLPNMAGPVGGMFAPGMQGSAMQGPGMPNFGMFAPGINGFGMAEAMESNQELEQPNENDFPSRNVKKTSIQGDKKKTQGKHKSKSSKKTTKARKKSIKRLNNPKFNATHLNASSLTQGRSRRSVDTEPKKKKSVHKLRPEKTKEQKGARKNSIVIHRPPIIYHPPPEIYHRPDIVVHRAPIMLHRPAIIYHQPPVVVHRPAIIYHQPSLVFHQPPPVVHQPIMHSHDTYVTRPVVYHSTSMMSHSTNFLGIPNHVYSYGGYHGYHGFHGNAFRKHSVPHTLKTTKAEVQGKIFKKSNTDKKGKVSRPKRDIYSEYLEHLDTMVSSWAQKAKRNADDEFDTLATKEAASEALTYREFIKKRDYVNTIHDKESRNRKKRNLDDDDDNYIGRRLSSKRKKDVVVNRPPIIYHPPPEVYHRPDIVVHRPPLVIHRPPIIYHQPPVIVHRPAVVYHQPPIVFHQPPPAVSQPLLFSHDSFTVHPSFYATHHGSVVRDYGHYIGIPNIVSNYGAPLFHSAMGKRSKINKPTKKPRKSTTHKANKKTKLHRKKPSTEKPHKKNSVLIRRPPIIYHPPPEIYHRPDIVVHRAPIMIHRAPIVYHQPPVVVHRPAIVYHQPSLVFHQPPPVVHQPMLQSHDTWVTHSVAVPYSSHVSHHKAYIGIPKHAYMNYHHFNWDDEGHAHGFGHAFYKSQVPKAAKASQRDHVFKKKKHKKSLKHKITVEEKGKRKNSVMIRRPPIIYHPPPEIFHRPDIVVHRPPILVHRAPIIYHQPPVIVHRPAIVYHQPNIVFHPPSPIVHQPIMQSHDTWITRPIAKLYGSTLHHLGAVTQIPHAYFNGHHHARYMAYGKSEVPANKKDEKASSRDNIKYANVEEDGGEGSGIENGSGDDEDEYNDDLSGISGISGSGELDIEVVKDEPVKSKLYKSKPRTEDASKKDKIAKHKELEPAEKSVKGSKKNSVVIHRPPIIYHPPPEIYHRPDIVVHRAPIVLYRAPIIYHQPPVVVHRPAIVYHQPSIVFHQPPPVVHQPVMHSHDTYVTHSVAVPVGSHVSHVGNYHGVPHEEIYMEGIGHGAFVKSLLPLRKSHKRSKIRREKTKVPNDLPSAKATNFKRPVGAGERIRRTINELLDKDLDIHKRMLHGKNRKRASKKKKKDVVVSRPPIIYHPPPEVYHRPEIVVHRAPILIHRPPIVYHQPPVVVHRPAVVYHQPPIVFHQPPPAVNQPLLYSHDQYVMHPASVAQHINSVVNEGGHYIGIPHGGIENYPGSLHTLSHMLPSFSPNIPVPRYSAGYKRTKVQRPNKSNVNEAEKYEKEKLSGSGDTNNNFKKSKSQKSRHTKGQRKNNVLVYRPPLVYHPPPEIYDRPDIVVHRPDIVVHRPAIVYHQSSVVIHRPPIVYSQPPVVFHQPPPLTHQPIVKSHDMYTAHHYFEPFSSVVHHAGSYSGAPHTFPGVNPYGWGMQQYEAHGPQHGSIAGAIANPAYELGYGPPYGPAYGPDYGPVGPAVGALRPMTTLAPGFGQAFGRSGVEKGSQKNKKSDRKAHEKASKRSRKNNVRHRRSTTKYHHHLHKQQIYPLIEHHETFFANPLLHTNGETLLRGQERIYTKSKVTSKSKHGNRTMKKKKGKIAKNMKNNPHSPYAVSWGAAFDKSKIARNGEKKTAKHRSRRSTKNQKKINKVGSKKNKVLIMRPPLIYHPPPEIYDRPSIIVHRPDLVIHRPSIVYHQSSVVIHRPPIIYQQPPVVFHQPPPMTSQPIMHANDYYMAHTYNEPYASHIAHAGTYVGAPHHFPGGWGFLSHHKGTIPYLGSWAPAFAKSKVPSPKSKSKKVKRSSEKRHRKLPKAKKRMKKGVKKNIVIAHRPPMIYHPPPEIYDRPDLVVHRPDLVIHRPSIVYHQPSVVVHRPPIIYHQPPVVFHQPSPMVHQPIIHSHDTYVGHPYYEPHSSFVSHSGSYVGAPHFYGGGFAYGYGGTGGAYSKSSVFKSTNKLKKINKDSKSLNQAKRNKVKERRFKTKENGSKAVMAHKKNLVIMRRPSVVYHPPPEIYHRPDVILHRPDIVIHRPSVVFHQSAVVVHRPAVVYHQPPLVFHQPPPMVHQPVMHSHETYLAHQYFEPHHSHVTHAGTYVGAPHFFHGGWGWGYGYHQGPGHAFGKSTVEDNGTEKRGKKKKSPMKTSDKEDDNEDDDDEDDEDMEEEGSDDNKNTKKTTSKKKAKRSLKSRYKDKMSSKVVDGHKKNLVVMHRPPVIYHPPPEIYHRPDVVVHRPDIVIHRPSVVFHQPSVLLHRPAVVYHQSPIVFHQPPPMVHQPIMHTHETYIPHHFFEPFHSHLVHAGTYVGAPHYYGGGWGFGYGHGHAFGKSNVEKKTEKGKHHKSKRDIKEDNENLNSMTTFLTKRSAKGKKKDSETHSHLNSKKTTKGAKKNTVLIHRPPLIYHPPPEIYDRPDIVVHRPELVYHQPSVVYHQSSVVVHRPPIIYHPPPVVFHQPPPLVHHNVLHAHDSYIAHQYFEPYASHIHGGAAYVGAPHFFGGGWGYGYGVDSHGPFMHPYGPRRDLGFYPISHMSFYNGYGFNSPSLFPEGPYAFHGPIPQAAAPVEVPAVAKSKLEGVHKRKNKHHKRLHKRTLNEAHHFVKKSKRVGLRDRHHKGHKKHAIVMNRPPIVYHQQTEVYHRPDIVFHRPDIVIHRPDIVMHQAPVVVHKPSIVYHQPPVVLHQPLPLVHQPVLYSHDAYAPHPYYEPLNNHVEHVGTYVGTPHDFGGRWGYGYEHVVGGYGKSHVENGESKKAHKTPKKDSTKNKQVKASKKGTILHAEEEKDVKAEKKNDIVVSRPPIIYHPPPEIYHRPDIVVHRAPIVLHRPPIIYHQPPVVVHRPAVVYHQPPIVFHQPPPAVHQPILHAHDTFVVHHSALYEPHGSTVSHETNYIGIPSHVEHYGEGMPFEGVHHGGYHGGFHRGFNNYHSGLHGFHGGYNGEPGFVLHRSNIEHVKKSSKDNAKATESGASTKSQSPEESRVVKDEKKTVKTRNKRQVLGSHSLYLPEASLNVVHPRGPIVERLQKMSRIPHAPSNIGRIVSKRNTSLKRRKRQLEDTEQKVAQAPVNIMETSAFPNRRIEILHPFRSVQPLAPATLQEPRLQYPQLSLFHSLAANPFLQRLPLFKTPEVNVHVETERSKVPSKANKAKSHKRKRRQVFPYIQSQLLATTPNLLLGSPSNPPFHHFDSNQMPELPAQIPPQYFGLQGINPMLFPYQMRNFGPRRPHVNINVQSARSKIPRPLIKQRRKRSAFKVRRKRQLFPINPYAIPFSPLAHGYVPFMAYPNRPFYPYWNLNPYFLRSSPEIPHPQDDQESGPNNFISLLNRYLNNLYDYYSGALFHQRRPKVSVDVHASKSNIPGSKSHDIVIRNRRQLVNYLPVSPLTTGQYHFSRSVPNFLSNLWPIKRSTEANSRVKRSKKERFTKRKMKGKIKEQNSKRDEFMSQRANSNQGNIIQINPNNPGPVQFGTNEQNNQQLNAGVEGLNEIGPGGLNGATAEAQLDRPQVNAGLERGSVGQEPKILIDNENLQQDTIQNDQPPQLVSKQLSDFQINGEQAPSFAQMQQVEGENRMAVPDNRDEMFLLRGQTPLLPPVAPLSPPQVQAPFLPPRPVLPQLAIPFMRPFAPIPFLPQPPFLPFNIPLPSQVQSFATPEQILHPSVNVNVNTVKSNLPGTKFKKNDSSITEKVVRRIVPDSNSKKSAKRQRISLLRRIPALQVLPQTFLQNGIQIPFTGMHNGKGLKSHGVNGMIISELQRKQAIPAKSKDKQRAQKRQFYQLPVPMNVQPLQPLLNTVDPLGYLQKPQVHVHVDVGKKKSELSENKSNNKVKTSTKVRRQIYGMNELPRGLKFPEEVADLSGDKAHVKKFKIRSDGDSDSKNLSQSNIHKRHIGPSAHNPEKAKQTALKAKVVKLDDGNKRQYVLGGERRQGYNRDVGEVHVNQLPQLVGQFQRFSQAGPQPFQSTTVPQQFIKDPDQQYINTLQPFVSQDSVVEGPHLAPQVNVNVQVSKSHINKKETSSKATLISKRQLFGTVPLLSSVGINQMNIVTKEGSERSKVPDNKPSDHSRGRRQYVAAQQPNQEIGVNVQAALPSAIRGKRQLYKILSGKQVLRKKAKQHQVKLSRRSVSIQMHEKGSKLIKKEKRQLQDLISNILERRGGPNKLLENILRRRKPSIMFTTNNDNNQKPLELFPGNAAANNPIAAQSPPNDEVVGSPFTELSAPSQPKNPNPVGTNLLSPFRNNNMLQDGQAALPAPIQQGSPQMMIRQDEPNGRQNVVQFLENAGLPNSLMPQQEMAMLSQRGGVQGIMPFPVPFLPAPPVGTPPVLGDQKSLMPIPGSPIVPPFGAQFLPINPAMAARPPVQFPFYPFMLPQMRLPDADGSLGVNQDSNDGDKPSVNVNVKTSKSKIPKSKKPRNVSHT